MNEGGQTEEEEGATEAGSEDEGSVAMQAISEEEGVADVDGTREVVQGAQRKDTNQQN